MRDGGGPAGRGQLARSAGAVTLLILFALSTMLVPGPRAAAAQSPPTLASQIFFGGPGDQRGTAIAIRGGGLFVTGNQQPESQGPSAAGFILRYATPPGAAPVWSRAFGFGTNFFGVAATDEGVYAAGHNFSLTTDNVGGKEVKGILAKFPLDGSAGPATGGASWLATPNYFVYTGVEIFSALTTAQEAGGPVVYAAGGGQPCSFFAYLVSKYDTAGNRLAAATDSSVGVRFDQCFIPSIGGSDARGVTILNGNVYLAGGSGWSHEDASTRPALWKYSPNLNLQWRAKDTTLAGSFNAVTSLGNALYAAGSAFTPGVAGSENFLVEKFDEAGAPLWRRVSGGAGTDVLTGVVSVGGRLFAVGHTSSSGAGGSDAIVLEIDPATGATLSTTLFGGAQDDMANAAATDGTDLYVVGESRSFGQAGNAVGQSDLMLLRYTFAPPVSPLVVTNTNDSGPGSLRNAIAFANANPGPDTIIFNIPTTDLGFNSVGGHFTIRPLSALPPLTDDGTTIAGSTQTAFTGDTNPLGPEVFLDGSLAASGNGLTVFSSNNVIAHLVVSGFPGSGVAISGTSASGNVVTRSFLGTDPTGTQPLGNTGSGVVISDGAHDNVVGPGNVIAFNTKFPSPNGGVAVLDGARKGAYPTFAGLNSDFVGVFPVLSFPNTGGPFTSADGITPVDGSGHPFADNFGARFTGSLNVSAAGAYTFRFVRPDDVMRVLIDGGVILEVSCCVQSAESPVTLTAGAHAIEVDFFDGPGAAGLTLDIVGPGTVGFTNNGVPGLLGEFFQLRIPTERNRITQNSIFQNGLLGIDLDALEDRFGANFNDPGDGDIGPNTALNSPVISSVVVSGSNVAISGTIDTSNPGPITIELFSSDVPDPSCSGEGQRFLGAVQALANGLFSATFTGSAAGPIFTATATDALGNTSEFSKAFPCPIVVTNTNDSGPGSLRAAINRANANPGPDTIIFNIPTTDPGFNLKWFTIKPLSPLPHLTDDGTTVDGRSQTAFTGDTNTAGPEVFLDGRDQAEGQAFSVQSSGNVIQGLTMSGFPFQAVLIQTHPPTPLSGNVVRGNYIGTDPTGQIAIPNGARFTFGFTPALSVGMGVDTVIGGIAPGDGNLVSGNASFGIDIVIGSRRTIVQGNRVGTDATGTRALPNGGHGVNIGEFGGATFDNVIGGTAPGAGNLISSNTHHGIFVTGSGHTIQGNFIGTDASGTTALPNSFGGVFIFESGGNTIGGTTVGARNVISGNVGDGITIVGGQATGNFVQGNFIGTDATGTKALGNSRFSPGGGGGFGVIFHNASGNTIGGSTLGARNVISANEQAGVQIGDPPQFGGAGGASGNLVQGNFIGTDVTGTAALGNGTVGVFVFGPGNTIGGTTSGARNVISGNRLIGMKLGGTANVVQGNYVGVDVTGERALGNGFAEKGGNGPGIFLVPAFKGEPPATNFDVRGNVISGNAGDGLHIGGVRNRVEGNRIGTNAAGTEAIPNGFSGISLDQGARDNVIGGTAPADRNIISGNVGTGVRVGPDSTGNVVQGNFIGTNASGTGALGNGADGVRVEAGPNMVGGATTGAGNVISGNGQKAGVIVARASRVTVQGNRIGVDVSGTVAIPNAGAGVILFDVSGSDVGGTTPEAWNVISGNREDGIHVGGTSTGNRIQGNFIGTDVTGKMARGNGRAGVSISASGNLVGGTRPEARNVISANGGALSIGGSGNLIQGNFIGTDVTGTKALGNARGIDVSGPVAKDGTPLGSPASNNRIGGTEPGAGNVISANGEGVHFEYAEGSFLEGNFIGTDVTGTVALGSKSFGVFTGHLSRGNVIGGADPRARNVVSANELIGMKLAGVANTVRGNYIGTNASGTGALPNGVGQFAIQPGVGGPGISLVQPFAGNPPARDFLVAENVISGNAGSGLHVGGTGSRIERNFIGTDASGTLAIPNGDAGIAVEGSDNVIGGHRDVARNVVSGNARFGIRVSGPRNRIQGNFIGTDVAGRKELGNGKGRPGDSGVFIHGGASDVLVGGAAQGVGNLISGNDGAGVGIIGSTAVNVQGNRIGTDVAGRNRVPNVNGVRILTGVTNSLVGGTEPGARNVISGNERGVFLSAAAGEGDTKGNVIQGNYVGTDVTGAAPLSNGVGVILFTDTGVVSDNTIGGTVPEARNLIAGNRRDGIVLAGRGVTGNRVQGNYVGLDATGTVMLGNGSGGILITGAPGNIVGGTVAAARNVISGNGGPGVRIGQPAATGNLVQGNFIGTDATGATGIPNDFAGVIVGLDASDNVIGGSDGGAGNLIAFNRGTGVIVSGACAATPLRNRISGNAIFRNEPGAPPDATCPDGTPARLPAGAGLGIDLGPAGVTPNDPGDADSGPNSLQNFPVIGTAETVGGDVVVTGALDTPDRATATIELFGNDDADPSGHGEGQRFATAVLPGADGCFSARLAAATAGGFVTATATDAKGNTSEFSRAIAVGIVTTAVRLEPATDTNTIGETHTVVATVLNSAGGPVPCLEVRFSVSGANTAAGMAKTDIVGQASFSYVGEWAGTDTITASAGTVSGMASKTWLFPASTPGRVTGGGQITTAAGSPNFGLTASGATGQLEYNDRGVRNVHSINVAATVVTGTRATIYGFATVNGAGNVQFRVEVEDNGEPGRTDVFRIKLSDGYQAGGVLARGNIQIHP